MEPSDWTNFGQMAFAILGELISQLRLLLLRLWATGSSLHFFLLLARLGVRPKERFLGGNAKLDLISYPKDGPT